MVFFIFAFFQWVAYSTAEYSLPQYVMYCWFLSAILHAIHLTVALFMIYEASDSTCQLAVPHRSAANEHMGSQTQGALYDLFVSGLDLSYEPFFSIYTECCCFIIWLNKTKCLYEVLVWCCVACSAENKRKTDFFPMYKAYKSDAVLNIAETQSSRCDSLNMITLLSGAMSERCLCLVREHVGCYFRCYQWHDCVFIYIYN